MQYFLLLFKFQSFMFELVQNQKAKLNQICSDLPGFRLNDTRPLSSASFTPKLINLLTLNQPRIKDKVFREPRSEVHNKTCHQVWVSLLTICAVLFHSIHENESLAKRQVAKSGNDQNMGLHYINGKITWLFADDYFVRTCFKVVFKIKTRPKYLFHKMIYKYV